MLGTTSWYSVCGHTRPGGKAGWIVRKRFFFSYGINTALGGTKNQVLRKGLGEGSKLLSERRIPQGSLAINGCRGKVQGGKGVTF